MPPIEFSDRTGVVDMQESLSRDLEIDAALRLMHVADSEVERWAAAFPDATYSMSKRNGWVIVVPISSANAEMCLTAMNALGPNPELADVFVSVTASGRSFNMEVPPWVVDLAASLHVALTLSYTVIINGGAV